MQGAGPCGDGSRALLEQWFSWGSLRLCRSPLFDQPPDPLPEGFDFGRVEGMLLGLAVGDALGNTSEARTPEHRRAEHGEIRDYLPNHDAGGRCVGLPSDDSQLAFWTLEQLLADGGLVLGRLAERFAGGRIFGIGRTVRGFLKNFKAGVPLHQCGIEAASNGALMRIAPVLVPHLRAPSAELWADTALCAALTHNDRASTAACVAFVGMLWRLLAMDRPPDPLWWPEAYVGVAKDLEGETTYRPRGGRYLDEHGPIWRFVQRRLLEEDWRRWPSAVEACNSWHSGAYLLETVPSVLYILMRHAADPEEAIIRAVNDTWDNDTVAAVVGAAVGALHGRSGLPARWIESLLGRTTADDDGKVFDLLDQARRRWGTDRPPATAEPAAPNVSGRYGKALDAAVAAARHAGELLRTEFHRPGGPRGGAGHADVDRRAEQAIRETLAAAFHAAYCGEETGTAPGDDPDHLWLVDPNDGTSAYLKGWRGSAVSIALLRRGVPVLGVVYAFAYPDDRGDLIAWAEGCGPLTRNGRAVTDASFEGGLADRRAWPPVVFLSQDADRHPAANASCVAPARFIAMPSIAYRLALAAVGDAVAGVSLNGPGGWDYAGGHALLRAVGGRLVDQNGKDITYDPQGGSATRSCFGGTLAAVEALAAREWSTVFAPPPGRPTPYPLVTPRPGSLVAEPGRLARAQGCLLGQLAGDNLGGLVEFRSAASIRAEYPAGVRQMADGGHWEILAGQPTDDSEMALVLARALVQAGGFDPARVLDAYVHWYRSPPFDIGGTTAAALRGAASASTPAERIAAAAQSANPSSQANGSLMRSSPLGILGAGRPAVAAGWARADSRLTHPHRVCQDCCAVYVAALAAAIADGGSPGDCYTAALDEARRCAADESVTEALLKAADAPPRDYQKNQGWVLVALQNAFHQLLHATDLEQGVVETIMQGGDTDTNAAIAGALLGAVHGRDAVPPPWTRCLLSCRPLPGSPTAHPRPPEFWPVDALRLAERLLVVGRQAPDASA